MFKGGLARVLRSSPQFGFTLVAYEYLHKVRRLTWRFILRLRWGDGCPDTNPGCLTTLLLADSIQNSSCHTLWLRNRPTSKLVSLLPLKTLHAFVLEMLLRFSSTATPIGEFLPYLPTLPRRRSRIGTFRSIVDVTVYMSDLISIVTRWIDSWLRELPRRGTRASSRASVVWLLEA